MCIKFLFTVSIKNCQVINKFLVSLFFEKLVIYFFSLMVNFELLWFVTNFLLALYNQYAPKKERKIYTNKNQEIYYSMTSGYSFFDLVNWYTIMPIFVICCLISCYCTFLCCYLCINSYELVVEWYNKRRKRMVIVIPEIAVSALRMTGNP